MKVLSLVLISNIYRNIKSIAFQTNNFEHPGHSENGSPTNMTSRFSRTCTYLRKIVFDPNIMKNPGMLLLLAIYHFWSGK